MKEFEEENTKEFFAKLYFNRSAVITPNQISGMLRAVISFCECFGSKTKKEVNELKSIYYDPIGFVIKTYPEYLSKKTRKRIYFKKSLAKLEWLYYRDGLSRTALNKEYYQESDKPKRMKRLLFEDIVELREWIIISVDTVFVKVSRENAFSLNFDVTAYENKSIPQVTAGKNKE